MSAKNLLKLLTVFAVLIGISIIIPRVVYRESGKKILVDASIDTIVRIVVNSKSGEIVLIKTDTLWSITSSSYTYNADKNAIKNILDAVAKLEINDVISSNEKRYDLFEVSDASGTRVQLFTKDTAHAQADFYIGKSSPDYVKNYLRFKGEKEVYLASGFSRYVVDKKLDRWRNRKIGAQEKEAVNAIILSENDKIQTLQRDAGKWLYNTAEIDQKDVDSLVGRIASLNASDLVTYEDEADIEKKLLNKSAIKLLIDEAGAKIEISFYPIRKEDEKKIEKYHAVKKGENGIFIVNEYAVKSIRDDFTKIKDSSLKSKIEPGQTPPQKP